MAGSHVGEEQANLLASSHVQNLERKFDALVVRIDSLTNACERTATSLHMLVMLAAAHLAWGLQDRLTGQWTVTNADWFFEFYEVMVKSNPMLWFMLAMFLWCAVAYGLKKLMDRINEQQLAEVAAQIDAAMARTPSGGADL